MSRSAPPGRRSILVAIAVLIALEILTIAFYAHFKGAEAVPSKVIRLCLTAALCLKLYQGFAWARWVVVGLLGLALAGSVVSVAWLWGELGENIDTFEEAVKVFGLIGTVFGGHLTAFLLLTVGPGAKQYFSPDEFSTA
ncbi:MAG: hypothetical protein ACYS26_06375 [Planctomycetota bacterium]|jgi:hypothetical protein